MFEVGFTELLLIFALALIVLGPEKLPRVAAQLGRWLGRARAMARQFREQLEEETILEETTRRPGAAAPPQQQPPQTDKYYQPDDDVARTDVSHADAGSEPDAEPAVTDAGATPAESPTAPPPATSAATPAMSAAPTPTVDHERGA